MPDTTHELSILARARDEASPVFRKMGAEGRRALDEVTAGSRRASDELGKVGKNGALHMETLKRSAGQVATGLFMMGTAADGVAGKLGQLVSHGAGAFAAGGPWMAGLSLATSLFGILTDRTARAREEQEKLAAEGRKAAEETRRAAEEKTREQQAYVRSLQEEIELLGAGADAGARKSIVDRRRIAAAGESGGYAGEQAMKSRIKAEDFTASSKERVAAEKDAAAAIEKAMEADRALGQSEANRRIGLRKDAEEYVRRSNLSAEQLRHDGERQKILELQKAGLAEQARAMQAALDATVARERQEQAVRARMDEQRESLRAIDEQERQMARDRAQEAQKRREENALALVLMEREADLWRQKQQAAQRATPERLDGRDSTGGWSPGSGMGPLATAREAKKQRARDERNQRHADNLAAEDRERMGFIDAGWVAPSADVRPRKSIKFKGPGGLVRNDDGSLYVPGQDDEARGPRPRRGGAGAGRDGSYGGPPVTSPSGENTPYVDGRALGDAVAQGAAGAKGADESLKQVTTDAKAMADSLEGIKVSSEQSSSSLQEASATLTQVATKEAEANAVLDNLKETAKDVLTRVEDRVKKIEEFVGMFTQLGKGG